MLPLATGRAQENTIPATTSSPAQSARRSTNIASVRRHLCGNGVYLISFRAETTGGTGPFTASRYFLFAKQLRDSGLPADVLVGKLNKDISFELRQGHDRPSDYTCP